MVVAYVMLQSVRATGKDPEMATSLDVVFSSNDEELILSKVLSLL